MFWPFKKKTALDSTKTVISLAKNIILLIEKTIKSPNSEYEQKRMEMLGSIRKLLNIIENVSSEEIEKLRKETNSDILIKSAEDVIKLAKKVNKESLRMSNIEIRRFVDEILVLEDHIYRELETPELELNKYELGKCIGKGNNSSTYEIKNYSDLVLQTLYDQRGFKFGTKNHLDWADKKVKLHKKISETINFARILEVGWKNGFAAVVMTRVKGSPLHERNEDYREWSKRIFKLSLIPQAQYNKLISDIKTLHSYGVSIDPSKPDNIFYDLKIGFTFLDTGMSNYIGSLTVPIIYSNRFFKFENDNNMNGKDASNVLKILDKLEKSGDHLDGNYSERIRKLIKDKFNI